MRINEMSGKMGKVVCFECGGINNYEMRAMVRKYEGADYSFELEVELPFCKECGELLVTEEVEEEISKRANLEIRKKRNIILVEEIKDILEKYSVSQKFLSRMLGWGEITLSRYIADEYTPNRENSDKLRSLKNPYVFQKYLNDMKMQTNGAVLQEKSYEKSQLRVNYELEMNELNGGKIYSVIHWFLEEMSNEIPLTHMMLQKLLYFVQNWSMAINGEWMFEDDCQAWEQGVVYPHIYEIFQYFGYDVLPKVNVEEQLSEKDLFILNMVKRYYYDVYNAKSLERICCLDEPFVERNLCNAKSREVISKERLKTYYCCLAKKYDISEKNTSGIKAYLNNALY